MGYEVEKDWTTKAGLRAVYIMTDMGHRCGYVAIEKGNPFYGLKYSDSVPDIVKDIDSIKRQEIGDRGVMPVFFANKEGPPRLDVIFDVHGGLTYAGEGSGKYPAMGKGLWWFGFDCAHAGDGNRYLKDGPVRSAEYVERQCEHLAEQIMEYANEK